MNSNDVISLLNLLKANGIDVWLDGGWGVDALLEKQTRPHEDVDIVIQEKDVPKLRGILEKQGYKDVPRDDTRPSNFVLGESNGNLIDVHAFRFDENGNGIYGEKGLTYFAESLQGKGKIEGQKIKCITAEYIVKFHSGYTPNEKDIKDVKALCERFGIELPKEYKDK